jgi:hypothetical protein
MEVDLRGPTRGPFLWPGGYYASRPFLWLAGPQCAMPGPRSTRAHADRLPTLPGPGPREILPGPVAPPGPRARKIITFRAYVLEPEALASIDLPAGRLWDSRSTAQSGGAVRGGAVTPIYTWRLRPYI